MSPNDEIIDAVAEPVKPARRTPWTGVVVLVLVLALAGLAAVFGPQWLAQFRPAPPQQDAAIPALQQQVEALSRRVAELAARPEPGPRIAALEKAIEGGLAEMKNTIADLSGKLDERNRDDPALSAKVAALAKNLDDLMEARAAGANEIRAAAVVLAVGQVRDAALAGGSYAAPLEALRQLGPDLIVPSALSSAAASGIATPAQLQAQFITLVPLLVAEATGDDWLAPMRRLFHRLVSVRRTGEVAGATNEARVARAEAKLAAGELAAAATELGELDGPARELAADWRRRAQQRVAVLTALDAMQTSAIGRLAAGAKN